MLLWLGDRSAMTSLGCLRLWRSVGEEMGKWFRTPVRRRSQSPRTLSRVYHHNYPAPRNLFSAYRGIFH
jgi:hypothetical protein